MMYKLKPYENCIQRIIDIISVIELTRDYTNVSITNEWETETHVYEEIAYTNDIMQPRQFYTTKSKKI